MVSVLATLDIPKETLGAVMFDNGGPACCNTRVIKLLILGGSNNANICAIGSKLPLFPYNGRWSSTIGIYIPIIRIPIIGGMTIPNIATFDHGTYGNFAGIPVNKRCMKFGLVMTPAIVGMYEFLQTVGLSSVGGMIIPQKNGIR